MQEGVGHVGSDFYRSHHFVLPVRPRIRARVREAEVTSRGLSCAVTFACSDIVGFATWKLSRRITTVTIETLLGLSLSAVLLIYLVYALLKPERF